MNLARLSNDGQITVPVEIRQALKIKAGDKILFFRKDNGEIVVQNPNISTINEAQTAIAESEYSEDEVLADVMNLRYGAGRS